MATVPTESVPLYPSQAQVIPLTMIRRVRVLPVLGEVLVHVGERVEPTQVVARVHQTQDFRILDVARALRVPRSQVKRFMLKDIGAAVEAGQPVAGHGGLFRRFVRAPVKGEIVAVGNGRILFEVEPQLIELRAYLKGGVTAIEPGLSVTIETPGAIVQGAWGCGGEAFGVLRAVSDKPDEPLRGRNIDVACHGAIVVGGGSIEASALEQAQQLQVRGLIAGSMEGELAAQAHLLPFPIILTEGWGRVPMAEPMFSLLSGQTGREASVSGETRSRFGAMRPEILIPLPTETRPSLPPPAGAPLTLGARVRVVRPPYMGAVGYVTALPVQAQRVDIGTRAHGVEVNLGGDHGTVFIPYVNLELLR